VLLLVCLEIGCVLLRSTNTNTITKLANKINIKKATGVDQISCKLLKVGAPVLSKHLTTLLNNAIKHSQFPNKLTFTKKELKVSHILV
jgi:hypothetical protein